MNDSEKLRELPAVHEVAERVSAPGIPRHLVVAEVRRVLDDARRQIRAGAGNGIATMSIEAQVERALRTLAAPSLRRVINATGVVLHTNLGRAPLGPQTIHPGYSNLEYDIATGLRGKRDVHTGALIERLLGAPGREGRVSQRASNRYRFPFIDFAQFVASDHANATLRA